jgi:hypothetical protein
MSIPRRLRTASTLWTALLISAVVGVADADFGEAVVAAVVRRSAGPHPDETEVIR